jgi:hypothetical protein
MNRVSTLVPAVLTASCITLAGGASFAEPAPAGRIDPLVFGRLERLGIRPAAACTDAVFVRRVYLDAIGTLPGAEEARAFLEDRSPDKRGVLVDRLLEREEFADYAAMKWCDRLRVKSEFPINLWPNAVQAYHRWIRTSIRDGLPYDRFVREMLTASGSNFRRPQVNLYRAVQSKSPRTLAQAVALTFMGTRADRWPEERQDGMAAFFSRVGYKSTAEWKEEIVYFDLAKADAALEAVFPDGTRVTIPPGQDPREVFADWLITAQNPWFARNAVNRVWSWLVGRGIIDEPDDIRPDNPPVHPELLALLEQELIANRYDLKSIYRMILKSKAYQLSCIPATNDPAAGRHFAFYPARRLEAETLIDAINRVTGSTEKYSSSIPEPYSFIPEKQRTIALADASITSPFLGLFGRSPRDTGLESERNNAPSCSQRLHLLNSSHIQRKLESCARIRALPTSAGSLGAAVDDLYLAILSRPPTADERKIVEAYRPAAGGIRQAGLDLAWALINTAEFQFRH